MPSVPQPVLEIRGIRKTYTQGSWWQRKFHRTVLHDVSLILSSSSTLGLIGKSGSGKTTLAMCLVGLAEPDAGHVVLEGQNLQTLKKEERLSSQRQIQLVFQDSVGALNPRMSAVEIVEEPLLLRAFNRVERAKRAEAMMERVGISLKAKLRRPHEFSGGQRQRLAIARALVLTPKVLILDEIFTGLDLSIRGQIANLLLELQQAQGLSYICISHDTGLVSQLADEIAILDNGRIVQQLSAGNLQTTKAGVSTRPRSAFGAGAT